MTETSIFRSGFRGTDRVGTLPTEESTNGGAGLSSVEATAASEGGERHPRKPWTFVRTVSLLITVVSILGAIVAWRASIVSTNASSGDQAATQDLVRQQQIKVQVQAQVDQDLRLFPRYLDHLRGWKTLKKQSVGEQATDPGLATELSSEAQDELSLARTLYQSLSVKPVFGTEEYDEEFAVTYLGSFQQELHGLDPDATAAAASDEHDRAVRLVGITALFIASLFFLTLAQVARLTVRHFFAGAGVLVLVIGTVLFIVAEVA